MGERKGRERWEKTDPSSFLSEELRHGEIIQVFQTTLEIAEIARNCYCSEISILNFLNYIEKFRTLIRS